VFLVDLRYWFIALKPLDASQIRTFAVYSLPFIAFFLVALRALHANLALARHGVAAQYAFNVLALAGGFVVFLVVQYGLLFSGQGLATFFMNDPLRIVVSINFVPLMCIVALVSTFTFRRTGSHIPGALICGLLVAWYVVVGQATQAAA